MRSIPQKPSAVFRFADSNFRKTRPSYGLSQNLWSTSFLPFNLPSPAGLKVVTQLFSTSFQRAPIKKRISGILLSLVLSSKSIYIDRSGAKMKKKGRRATSGFAAGRKSVLVVLFIPSVQRDGITPIDQESWVTLALEMFGGVFGGATAYPRAGHLAR